MKHINIPLFIQHMGCPNQCVFCDQRAITAAHSFSLDKVREDIEAVLSTKGEAECEIAFFGGSFTGIDRKLMINLLDIAEEYVKSGDATGIRMSTRPDYISDEICDILDSYTVSEVELGIQSFDDKVLSASRRGHTAMDSIAACELLRGRGYKFVGQMMIGLPESTSESELATAERICSLGAVGTRIYPLIVFKDTPLCSMAKNNEYIPLSLDEAVKRSADVYEIFLKNNVKCLKIGLHETENLHSDETFFAGPNHPALGELVKSEIYYRRIVEKLSQLDDISNKKLLIEIPKGAMSKVVGHKGENKRRIIEKTSFKNVKILENNSLMEYNIYIKHF